MATGFKVITLKPQKVGKLGRVDAGVDVTEALGTFRHLQSLVEMGEVMLVPVTGDFPTAAKSASVSANSPTADATAETPASVIDGEEPSVAEGGVTVVDYMDDPTAFTIEEVIAYAEAHPDHASMLLELETEGKNRKRVVKALATLAES